MLTLLTLLFTGAAFGLIPLLVLMALLERSFSRLWLSNGENFFKFFDLAMALEDEDGLEEIDGLDWTDDFGLVNFGSFFTGLLLRPSKSMTNVSQPSRLTTSCTMNDAFESQYWYELSFFKTSLFFRMTLGFLAKRRPTFLFWIKISFQTC